METRKQAKGIGALLSAAFVAAALVGLFVAVRGSGEASAAAKPVGSSSLGPALGAEASSPAIHVSFKLDPRLTRSLYMGDQWVSPPTYQHAAQAGESSTLEARAELMASNGAPLAARLTWKPADPEMVSVSPSTGNQVRITVRRAGESRLKLAYGAASKDLVVKAVQQNGIWRVDVVQ